MDLVVCPPHFAQDMSLTPPCAPKCPYEVYPLKYYDIHNGIMFAFCLIAVIFSVLVTIPYLFIKKRAAWPQTLPVIIFFMIFLLCGSVVVTKMIGPWEQTVCKSETEVADSGWCAASGAIMYSSALCAAICLMFISVLLLAKIKLWHLPSKIVQSIIVCTISFGIPFTLGLYSALSGKIVGNPILTVCFIDPNYANGWYLNAVWNFPLAFCLLVVFVSMGLVFYEFRGHWKNLTKTQGTLIAFIAVFTYPVLFLLFAQIYLQPKQDSTNTSIINWFGNCLGLNFFTGLGNAPNTTDVVVFNGFIKDLSESVDNACSDVLQMPNYWVSSVSFLNLPVAANIFSIIYLLPRDILSWWGAYTLGWIWPDKYHFKPESGNSKSQSTTTNTQSASVYMGSPRAETSSQNTTGSIISAL